MTRVTVSLRTRPEGCSTQARTWILGGFGQIIPKNRMIAPANPAPLTPVASAIDASPLGLLPPGRMVGERTSTARSRFLSSATSKSCCCLPVWVFPAVLSCRLLVSADVSRQGAWRRSVQASSAR